MSPAHVRTIGVVVPTATGRVAAMAAVVTVAVVVEAAVRVVARHEDISQPGGLN